MPRDMGRGRLTGSPPRLANVLHMFANFRYLMFVEQSSNVYVTESEIQRVIQLALGRSLFPRARRTVRCCLQRTGPRIQRGMPTAIPKSIKNVTYSGIRKETTLFGLPVLDATMDERAKGECRHQSRLGMTPKAANSRCCFRRSRSPPPWPPTELIGSGGRSGSTHQPAPRWRLMSCSSPAKMR